MTILQRLIEVNLKIQQHEVELDRLCAERDQLAWRLDEGDHSE